MEVYHIKKSFRNPQKQKRSFTNFTTAIEWSVRSRWSTQNEQFFYKCHPMLPIDNVCRYISKSTYKTMKLHNNPIHTW